MPPQQNSICRVIMLNAFLQIIMSLEVSVLVLVSIKVVMYQLLLHMVAMVVDQMVESEQVVLTNQ